MRERIQKIISSSGVCSRRRAEEYIRMGRVRCNGAVVSLGDSADPENDVITLDGVAVEPEREKLYIMVNKPRGYVTTMSDERGRKTVKDLIPDIQARIYPAGRLDLASEGLLIMTNDGEAAKALTHPSARVPKLYRVTVTGSDVPGAVSALGGMRALENGEEITPPAVALLSREGDRASLELTIFEGKNRQVRRMCALAGLEVRRLRRLAVGQLQLGQLKPGQWRELTRREVRYLKNL